MLAVVVLVPLAIMVLACVLERFEAKAVPTARTARASRADLRTPVGPLRLVPGAAGETSTPDTAGGPEAPAAGLRRAS